MAFLNERGLGEVLSNVKTYIDTKSQNEIIKITWLELKNLRDEAALVPGNLYRITDYKCVTTEVDTKSADHPFDIILMALDESHLSEEGWVTHNELHQHFINCDLNAWKVWYCLDNDKTRFKWCGEEFSKTLDVNWKNSVRGATYVKTTTITDTSGATYKVNEWTLDWDDGVPVTTTMYTDAGAAQGAVSLYDSTHSIYYFGGGDGHGVYTPGSGEYYLSASITDAGVLVAMQRDPSMDRIDTMTNMGQMLCWTDGVYSCYTKEDIDGAIYGCFPLMDESYEFSMMAGIGTLVDTRAPGVVYRLIDEHGNDCPYDFKNIMFLRDAAWIRDNMGTFSGVGEDNYGGSDVYLYTFTGAQPQEYWYETIADYSTSSSKVKNNRIYGSDVIEYGDLGLPNNVMIFYDGGSEDPVACSNNVFEASSNNTIILKSMYNEFTRSSDNVVKAGCFFTNFKNSTHNTAEYSAYNNFTNTTYNNLKDNCEHIDIISGGYNNIRGSYIKLCASYIDMTGDAYNSDISGSYIRFNANGYPHGLKVNEGVSGSEENYTEFEIPDTTTSKGLITVDRNSAGELKIFKLADLIL